MSLKKEPMLHILNNPLESQFIGPCRRANKTALFLGPSWLWTFGEPSPARKGWYKRVEGLTLRVGLLITERAIACNAFR